MNGNMAYTYVSDSHGAPAGLWTNGMSPNSDYTMPHYHDDERARLRRQSDAHDTLHTDPSRNGPKEWIPVPLQPCSVSLFIAVAVSLIIAIIALLGVSLRKDGFVTVGSERALTAYGLTWSLTLLWTTLPSLVFTLLGLHWAAIASAASDRQPFVSLNQPGGGLARETVLLDYRASIPLTRWCAAFRNGHWVVGLALLAALIFTVLSPLAASLFVATSTFYNQQVPVVFNSTLDQNAMNTTLDIRLLLDSVMANLVYGASPHPWTDSEHAFRPFYTAFQLAGQPPPTNATSLTAPTVAYAGYTNCSVLQPGPDYTISVKSQSSSSPQSAQLVMTGTDRGCAIQQEFTVSELQSVYFITTPQLTCSLAAGYSRLLFTYGHWSATAASSFLANVSVVSCAVAYRRTNGSLSVTVPSSSSRGGMAGAAAESDSIKILGFTPTGVAQDARDDAPGFWMAYERLLFQSASFTADTAWSTSDFGTVVLYRALQRQGGGGGASSSSTDNTTVLGGDVLAESVADVFTSAYLTAMETFGLVPTTAAGGRADTETGTMATQLTRLFVVPWVAGIVVGILAFIAAVAVSVLVHIRRHKTLLYEEPAGLLACAGLLHGSDLLEVARRVRDSANFDGRLVSTVLESGRKGPGKGGEGDLVWNRWKMSAPEGLVRPRLVIAGRWDTANMVAAD